MIKVTVHRGSNAADLFLTTEDRVRIMRAAEDNVIHIIGDKGQDLGVVVRVDVPDEVPPNDTPCSTCALKKYMCICSCVSCCGSISNSKYTEIDNILEDL